MSVKVEEGNKLIHEFMHGKPKQKIFIPKGFKVFEVNYMTWDNIIPVVEKIESLGHTVIIEDTSCTIFPVHDGEYGVDTGNKLSSAYECVVDFIQWYNTQNNTQ